MDTADTPALPGLQLPAQAPEPHTERPVDVPVDQVPPVKTLLKAAAPGWQARLSRARGPLEFGGLSADTDSDGKRHRVTRVETVDSVVARLHHPRTGRGAVALWIRRDTRTKSGKPTGYSFDLAYRGRHDGETTPVALGATALKEYVAQVVPVADVVELRPDTGEGVAA